MFFTNQYKREIISSTCPISRTNQGHVKTVKTESEPPKFIKTISKIRNQYMKLSNLVVIKNEFQEFSDKNSKNVVLRSFYAAFQVLYINKQNATQFSSDFL